MRTYLILFSCLLFSFTLNAQKPPGYVGKLNYFQVNGSFMVLLGIFSDFADESNPYDKISIHKDFGIQYGRVVSRTQALTIGANFYNFDLKTDVVVFTDGGGSIYRRNIQFDIRANTFDFGYYKFRTEKGALAPLGVFSALHLQTTSFTEESTPEGIDLPEYKYWAFGWELGQNVVIKDKILFNYGIRFNFPFDIRRFGTAIEYDEYFYRGDYSTFVDYNDEVVKQRLYNAMLRNNFVNFKLGLAYLF